MNSTTRMHSLAASSMLRRHSSVDLKLTERGYELTCEGEEPVVCESWPRVKRVLRQLGVPDDKFSVIADQLSEGKGIVMRTEG